ncbi:hypothetical protein NBRC110019_15010 [Neptunitalea chrysea]|uniref:Transmembrane protein n=1 Tax=Neptunitalea chrysea TaxID=1647581 RepID=A0A9W6EV40_9FLAO|nr:hypothetical protein [Neptunitalea chrysea]GLB52461.1 hypothetical protein NBRC110019_15010 [Neptunitalea chrysea]
MTSLNNQYIYCKNCIHRDFNVSQGTLCGLTKEKPNFANTCPQFILDPTLEELVNDVGIIDTDTILFKNTHGIVRPNKKDERYAFGLTAGIFAGLVGATLWTYITIATLHHIGYIAFLIGAGIALAVRTFGKGYSEKFCYTAAIITVFSCLTGHFFSIFGYAAQQEELSLFKVLFYLDNNQISSIYFNSFTIMSILIYAIAAMESYMFTKHGNPKKLPFSNINKTRNKRSFLNRD